MSKPVRVRKRPVEVAAIQFDGTEEGCDAVLQFMQGSSTPREVRWKATRAKGGYIQSLEGEEEFLPGVWIIRGLKGECYPCQDDIFRMTYDFV